MSAASQTPLCDFLAEYALPMMRGAAEFYLGMLRKGEEKLLKTLKIWMK